MRIGMGYDVHKLTEGRPLILGGVTVPWEKRAAGPFGCGCAGSRDHGRAAGSRGSGGYRPSFSGYRSRYKGISSIILLEKVGELLREKGYEPGNIDATIIAQKPKLRPYIDEMRKHVAAALDMSVEDVSVKATTEEGLGFTGTQEGISLPCGVPDPAKREGRITGILRMMV